MPQGVYVDGRNNVRVVEVGPIGPSGFGGSGGPSGPAELLPMTMSRLVPFVGWTQMGMPFNTMALYGHRIGIAFANIPMITVTTESALMPMAPIYIAKEVETLNYAVSAFGIDFVDDVFPENTQFQVVMSIGNVVAGVPAPTEVILGTAPMPTPNFSGIAWAEGDFEALIDENMMRFEVELGPGDCIVGIQMRLLDENGDPFSSGETTTVVALLRTSLWKGSPSAKTHVDPYNSVAYLGQMADTKMLTMYNYGLFGQSGMMVNGSGLVGSGIRFTEDGLSTEGLEATIMMEPNDDTTPTFVRWRANRLAVDTPPEAPTDVLRLMDAPDFTPSGLRLVTPSENNVVLAAGDTLDPALAGLYEVIIEEALSTVLLNIGNVAAGFIAHPWVIVKNTSSGPATVTVHGANSTNHSQVIGPAEVWLMKLFVWQKTPPESPDLGEYSVSFIKLYAPTVPESFPEIPKTGLTKDSLVDGKVPITYDQFDLGPADGSEILFTNPGDGRYAIFKFNYTAGVSGEPFTVQNANHYIGGTPEDPGTLIPGQVYRWTVYVQGTESDPPYVDFRQEYP